MRFQLFFLLFFTITILGNCSPDKPVQKKAKPTNYSDSKPVSHQQFSTILQKYVSVTGRVNYRRLQQDTLNLNQYLNNLSRNPPGANWSSPEKLAFWINAYNAFTLQLVLRHYPVKSIKDIGSKFQIPFVNSVWDIAFINIGDNKMTLNQIEHQILRKEFKEPRIHFAIVCASVSCPKLRREAYTGAALQQQLDDQARSFINDATRNQLQPDKIKISKIFSWFQGDFTRKEPLTNYLNRYSQIKINANARVSTLTYNWSLNE